MAVAIFRTTKGLDINKPAERSESEAEKLEHDNRLERISEVEDDDESGNDSTPETIPKDFSVIPMENIRITFDKENPEDGLTVTTVQDEYSIPLPQSVKMYHKRIKKATIDVWWLYDDGGNAIFPLL